MGNQNSREELEASIELMTDKVKNNITIIDANELKYPFMYHVGAEKNPTYIPRIGQRQSDKEDRTVPRVTVSTSLIGCILGYSMLMYNFFNLPDTRDNKGGLYIHRVPFEYALKPTSKLTYVRWSDEHWLTTYNKDTVTYKGQCIGKLIVKEVLCKPIRDSYPDYTVKALLELTAPMPFSSHQELNPGYYLLTIPFNDKLTHKNTNKIIIENSTKEEFMGLKKEVAVLLSADNMPVRNFLKKW